MYRHVSQWYCADFKGLPWCVWCKVFKRFGQSVPNNANVKRKNVSYSTGYLNDLPITYTSSGANRGPSRSGMDWPQVKCPCWPLMRCRGHDWSKINVARQDGWPNLFLLNLANRMTDNLMIIKQVRCTMSYKRKLISLPPETITKVRHNIALEWHAVEDSTRKTLA